MKSTLPPRFPARLALMLVLLIVGCGPTLPAQPEPRATTPPPSVEQAPSSATRAPTSRALAPPTAVPKVGERLSSSETRAALPRPQSPPTHTAAAPMPLPFPASQAGGGPRPPLTPRWAYEPWVWEDEENTAEAVRDLVDGYQRRGIPVGAVIIDSPWQTNYSTFQFNRDYPDPGKLISDLHGRGVKVLLWTTCFVNVSSEDGPERGKAATYDEALARGYFVDGGTVYSWDKGEGSAIDFFNPEAVAWWYAQMDRAWSLGPDGWKVDSHEGNLPDFVQTAAGPKTQGEYGTAYYRAFYRYVAERSPEAIITARPYDGGSVYAPLDVTPAGWVGDQIPDWGPKGIQEALDNILASAELGYAVLGSDIGGYRPGERFVRLFLRWVQLGALSPLMENGGRGEHRPWEIDRDIVDEYRYYARLHHQLVPYLYGAGVEAHQTGRPIIRDVSRAARQYTLGEDLLVAPITTRDDERDVSIPGGARWHDYWDDDRVITGPTVERYRAAVDRIPLYIKAGAMIPMQVADKQTGHGDLGSAGSLTLLVYPSHDGESQRTYRPDAQRSVAMSNRRDGTNVTIEIGSHTERYTLRIKESHSPGAVTLRRTGGETALPALASWAEFDGADEGWFYDSPRRYLWARFDTQDSDARLTYNTPP